MGRSGSHATPVPDLHVPLNPINGRDDNGGLCNKLIPPILRYGVHFLAERKAIGVVEMEPFLKVLDIW